MGDGHGVQVSIYKNSIPVHTHVTHFLPTLPTNDGGDDPPEHELTGTGWAQSPGLCISTVESSYV